MGDIRRSQGKSDEALDLFQRALGIFRQTIGPNHYITADTCYRLAEQLIRTGQKDEAEYEFQDKQLVALRKLTAYSRLLEQSLKVYGDIRWYQPQASRSAFMKGRLLRDRGNEVEGDAQLEKAMKIRKMIAPGDRRSWDQLSDADFDSLVYYYSR